MISTDNLGAMPAPDTFCKLMKSLAVLESILCPDWEYRYYSFDSKWSDGEMMASMRNGSGDQWFAIICDAGIALHGLAHESSAFRVNEPQPWIFKDLPEEFHGNLLAEKALHTSASSFCIWRLAQDRCWRTGAPENSDDGSKDLLSILEGNPQQYVDFADEYYETEIAVQDVQMVYRHTPLTQELAIRLNAEVDYDAVIAEAKSIGYPDPE